MNSSSSNAPDQLWYSGSIVPFHNGMVPPWRGRTCMYAASSCLRSVIERCLVPSPVTVQQGDAGVILNRASRKLVNRGSACGCQGRWPFGLGYSGCNRGRQARRVGRVRDIIFWAVPIEVDLLAQAEDEALSAVVPFVLPAVDILLPPFLPKICEPSRDDV